VDGDERRRSGDELEAARLELERARSTLTSVRQRSRRQRERFEAQVEKTDQLAETLARTRADLERLRREPAVRLGVRLKAVMRRLPGGARFAARSSSADVVGAPVVASPGPSARRVPGAPPSLAIHIGPKTWAAAATWGDTEFARSLERAFQRRGWGVSIHTGEDRDTAVAVRADVALHVVGVDAPPVRPGQLALLWVISHPDRVSPRLCEPYDLVFVASDVFAANLAERVAPPVRSLHQATDPDRFFPEPGGPEHELLFVGNSRRVRRPILDALAGTSHGLAVYGGNWTPDLLDPRHLRGAWIPNDDLRRYYSSAGIVLSDHWPDMRDEGFVSNRVYDALACGAFVLSDAVLGIDDEFDGGLATYQDPDELEGLVEAYLADPVERRRRAERGRAAVLARHTFAHRVDAIIAATEPLLEARGGAPS
jgi:hypothetical protein